MIRKVFYLLIVSLVLGTLVTALTVPLFCYTLFEEIKEKPNDWGGTYISGCFKHGRGFPLICYLEMGRIRIRSRIIDPDFFPASLSDKGELYRDVMETEILVIPLLCNIGCHTFATLGIIGIILIKTKKSNIGEYGFHNALGKRIAPKRAVTPNYSNHGHKLEKKRVRTPWDKVIEKILWMIFGS